MATHSNVLRSGHLANCLQSMPRSEVLRAAVMLDLQKRGLGEISVVAIVNALADEAEQMPRDDFKDLLVRVLNADAHPDRMTAVLDVASPSGNPVHNTAMPRKRSFDQFRLKEPLGKPTNGQTPPSESSPPTRASHQHLRDHTYLPSPDLDYTHGQFTHDDANQYTHKDTTNQYTHKDTTNQYTHNDTTNQYTHKDTTNQYTHSNPGRFSLSDTAYAPPPSRSPSGTFTPHPDEEDLLQDPSYTHLKSRLSELKKIVSDLPTPESMLHGLKPESSNARSVLEDHPPSPPRHTSTRNARALDLDHDIEAHGSSKSIEIVLDGDRVVKPHPKKSVQFNPRVEYFSAPPEHLAQGETDPGMHGETYQSQTFGLKKQQQRPGPKREGDWLKNGSSWKRKLHRAAGRLSAMGQLKRAGKADSEKRTASDTDATQQDGLPETLQRVITDDASIELMLDDVFPDEPASNNDSYSSEDENDYEDSDLVEPRFVVDDGGGGVDEPPPPTPTEDLSRGRRHGSSKRFALLAKTLSSSLKLGSKTNAAQGSSKGWDTFSYAPSGEQVHHKSHKGHPPPTSNKKQESQKNQDQAQDANALPPPVHKELTKKPTVVVDGDVRRYILEESHSTVKRTASESSRSGGPTNPPKSGCAGMCCIQ